MLNVTRCHGKKSSGCSGCSGNRRKISAGNAERQRKARPANWFLRGDSLPMSPDGWAELISPKQSVKVWPLPLTLHCFPDGRAFPAIFLSTSPTFRLLATNILFNLSYPEVLSHFPHPFLSPCPSAQEQDFISIGSSPVSFKSSN